MPLPKPQDLLHPILALVGEHEPLKESELVAKLADRLGLTERDRQEQREGVKNKKNSNKFDWLVSNVIGFWLSPTYFWLSDSESRNSDVSAYRLTEVGRAFLQSNESLTLARILSMPPFRAPDNFTVGMNDLDGFPLEDFDAHKNWDALPRKQKKQILAGEISSPVEKSAARGRTFFDDPQPVLAISKDLVLAEPAPATAVSHQEAIEKSVLLLNRQLAQSILEKLSTVSPSRFEQIVVHVLVAMGYGGSAKDAAKQLGGTGDGGIDGVIKEDRLGLDLIYVQAKRWQNVVGRPEIQKFAGALQGRMAKRGIFITTSAFTSDAIRYAEMIESRIILINGQELAIHMLESGVGVVTRETVLIRKLDDDYFK